MCGFSQALGAVGSLVGGIQAQQEAKARARGLEAEARFQRRQAAWEAARLGERLDREEGTLLAQLAGSGRTLEGSTLEAALYAAAAGRAQQSDVLTRGSAAAAQSRSQASFARFQGQQALTGALFGAGTSLLTGAERQWPGTFGFS